MADLLFTRLYTPRSGLSVELNFNPPSPTLFSAAVDIIADDVVVSGVVISTASAAVAIITDDVIVSGAVVSIASAAVAFTTDDVNAEVVVGYPHNADVTFTTDDAVCAALAYYDADVSRGIEAGFESVFSIATKALLVDIKGAWHQSAALSPDFQFAWQNGGDLDVSIDCYWQLPPFMTTSCLVDFRQPHKIDGSVTPVYQSPMSSFSSEAIIWQPASTKSQSLSSDWYCPAAKFNDGLIAFKKAIELGLMMDADSSGAASLLQQLDVIVWQSAGVPWIVNKPVVPPVVPPKYWSSDLLFSCQKPAWVNGKQTILVFKLIGCPWPILPFIKKQRAYVIVNDVAVFRLPEMIPLDVLSVNITGDVDSWAWSFTATLKTHRQLDLIKPDSGGNPREIRVVVNGEWWDFIVEGRSTPREFGNTSITIKGRSLSAYLAEPFAPITDDSNADDVLANQIADLAVLNTEWSVDWQLTDWLVLAGAWNYRGAPMGRLLQIAEAVGGVVASAPAVKSVSLVKRYPVLPWDWAAATPYAQIPADVMLFLGGESDKKPDYNGVYVAGESVGVGALVKRQGTAGDVLAPTKINPLLTHVDACRMAGESILAEAGAVELIPFVMPVEPTLGILPLNELLEIDDGGDTFRGMTRSIQISAQWGDSLVVRQTVEIERRG